MKKILTIIEVFASIGLLIDLILVLSTRNHISYEVVGMLEKTPKSSIFIVMNHNPLLGYSMLSFGLILAISTIIRGWTELQSRLRRQGGETGQDQ